MQLAWVIEDGMSSPSAPLYATWKSGIYWSYNHEDAARFSRKQDAVAYAARHCVQDLTDGTTKAHRICEHQWG